MMTTPERHCDLCGNPITTPIFPMFMLPLTDEQLQSIAVAQTNSLPAPVARILGNIQPIVLPSHYRFDFCQGCVDGFMPMMDTLREKAVASIIERIERRKAKASGDTEPKINIADDED